MWIPVAQGFWVLKVCCQFLPSYKVFQWVNVQFLCSFGQPTVLCWHSLVTDRIGTSWEVRVKTCYPVERMWVCELVQRAKTCGILIWWIVLKDPVLKEILQAFPKLAHPQIYHTMVLLQEPLLHTDSFFNDTYKWFKKTCCNLYFYHSTALLWWHVGSLLIFSTVLGPVIWQLTPLNLFYLCFHPLISKSMTWRCSMWMSFVNETWPPMEQNRHPYIAI